MAIVLSANQLSAVEGCLRAMQFRFGARLRSGGDSQNLTIGSAVHAGLAAYYHNIIVPTGNIDMWAQIDHEIKNKATTSDIEELNKLSFQAKRLHAWYIDPDEEANGVAKDKEDNLNPVQLETLFHISLCEGVEVVGIIDMLNNFHRSAGMKGKVITDHKTSQRGGASWGTGLQYDPQAFIYAWAARESGWTADWFCWNVIVKTQKPYLMRLYEPIFWPRVDMYMERAREFGKWIAAQPQDVEEILAMPGNPGQCRRCIFPLLCDNPTKAKVLAASQYRNEDYTDFSKFRTLPPEVA